MLSSVALLSKVVCNIPSAHSITVTNTFKNIHIPEKNLRFQNSHCWIFLKDLFRTNVANQREKHCQTNTLRISMVRHYC